MEAVRLSRDRDRDLERPDCRVDLRFIERLKAEARDRRPSSTRDCREARRSKYVISQAEVIEELVFSVRT
jgi:hypothetical protein